MPGKLELAVQSPVMPNQLVVFSSDKNVIIFSMLFIVLPRYFVDNLIISIESSNLKKGYSEAILMAKTLARLMFNPKTVSF